MDSLDSVDVKLLQLLQSNSRLTTKELAVEVAIDKERMLFEFWKRIQSSNSETDTERADSCRNR